VSTAQLTAPVPAPLLDVTTPERPRQRRGTPRRILRFLTSVVLAVAAVAAVGGAGVVVVQRLGFSPVLSPSMLPVFGPGDLIVTKPLDTADLRVGDVVVLPLPDSPGQRYVHRVIKVETDDEGLPAVSTKGDNNDEPDPWRLSITSRQVPEVVASIPDAGRLALRTNGAQLRVPLLLLVAGAVLVATKRALL
jgi:signal peptidase